MKSRMNLHGFNVDDRPLLVNYSFRYWLASTGYHKRTIADLDKIIGKQKQRGGRKKKVKHVAQ